MSKAIGELERGDLFRWDPTALEAGEDPDTLYVVYEKGRFGGVQVIPLGTGLPFPPINTVGRDWLTLPTGERAMPEDAR